MYVNFVLNFLSHSIFIFPLFLSIIMYANEFETKEKKINSYCNIKLGFKDH